jgi:hypothetical protein
VTVLEALLDGLAAIAGAGIATAGLTLLIIVIFGIGGPRPPKE